jgi:hypothetical protein
MFAFNGRRRIKLVLLGGRTRRGRRSARRFGNPPAGSSNAGAASSERGSVQGTTTTGSNETTAGFEEVREARRDRYERSGEGLARAAERGVGSLLRVGVPLLNRHCATLASLLGALGVLFGLVPLFFGLAWNFGGVAATLAIYALYRQRRGDRRISLLATKTGFVLGVSAIVLGCWDLAVVAAGW